MEPSIALPVLRAGKNASRWADVPLERQKSLAVTNYPRGLSTTQSDQ
jgi:hypothetical protein